MLQRDIQRVPGSGRTHTQDVKREPGEIDRAGRARQVENQANISIEQERLTEIMLDEREVGVIDEMRDVLSTAGQQVIDGDNPHAFAQQRIARVGADEACPSSDQSGFMCQG
jgi:hypothetical protein